ncbi:uncharacterized protein LOC126750304 [Anthonomus grandis grandis]|uniref:uncharacterized protein LOC126737173 n=1 Tax=Anthonomus grandis grandis TaxID=2921223 RepID=UPI00216574AF|nr:uncharacterized protein LOC126737173 [Anthonomus grandis grandis]XP_050315838.1 uncharacterized protein LOC126750304 [Anthonomus grandis grandis]
MFNNIEIEKNLFDLSSEEDDSEDEHTNNLLSCMLMADKRKHRFWISNHLVERKQFGEFHKLIPVLSDEQFKNYFRLSRAQFVEIHELIRFEIIKLNTNYRESVTTEERLGVCLRFLATGDSYKTIGYSFRLGERTVSKIVNEVCSSLWSQLQPTFMKMPDQESWKAYELEFRERWQFPKCVGAIDGKHVVIKAPPNSGSSFFNYKKTFSVVLMAIASANYQLIAVDIGSSGRFSDGGIFADSPIGRRLKTNSFNFPEPSLMENYNEYNFPFVLVGDEAFPLMVNLMRPFPRRSLNKENRVFNYRLSRARRVIENTFGILAARFRIYKRPLECKLESIDSIIKATCVLHNYLGTREGRSPNINEEQLGKSLPENQWLPLAHRGVRATAESFAIRQNFCNYFNSDTGRIPWQDKIM